MAALSTTRTAIKDALDAAGLRAYDYAPSSLNTPCVIVGFPTRYNPNDTMSDTNSYTIPVTLYVSYAANGPAEDALEDMIPTVIDAVEDISGAYSVAVVRDFGVLENGNAQPIALGCVVDVDVLA